MRVGGGRGGWGAGGWGGLRVGWVEGRAHASPPPTTPARSPATPPARCVGALTRTAPPSPMVKPLRTRRLEAAHGGGCGVSGCEGGLGGLGLEVLGSLENSAVCWILYPPLPPPSPHPLTREQCVLLNPEQWIGCSVHVDDARRAKALALGDDRDGGDDGRGGALPPLAPGCELDVRAQGDGGVAHVQRVPQLCVC